MEKYTQGKGILEISDPSAHPRMRGLSDEFWHRVQSADQRLLMLDYDGTLAPFHVSRMNARPTEKCMAVLRSIVDSGHTKLAIVSGRPANEVRSLLPSLPVETFGAHGFERSPIEGTVLKNPLSKRESAGLDTARAAAEAAGLADKVELKPASLAVHLRGIDPKDALAIEELAYNIFSPIANKHGLECRTFNGGVELRSKRFHKGHVVKALLSESQTGVFAVYVGDDDTDEDAFRALGGEGIGVRVGGTAEDTAAQLQLASQAEVLPFLEQWHACATRRGPVIVNEAPRRLVIVSNRLPAIGTDTKRMRHQPVGGLATALEAALSRSRGGGLWMGWSGSITAARGVEPNETSLSESVQLLGIDLTRREYEAYYNGFANRTIWPLFHSFPRFTELSGWQLEIYRSVNAMFAQSLTSMLRENDLVWVHDYHLMLLGDELRKFGWKGRTGFFLHIPFPALDILSILPGFVDFLKALQAYDVVGFQTAVHRDNYLYACRRKLGAEWDGRYLRWGERRQTVGVHPIGIDIERFLPETVRTRGKLGQSLRASLSERDLILGVDRMDYTKGMPQRVLAFEALLRRKPQLKRRVSYIQICSPSRTDVEQYKEQRRVMDTLVGRVNGELGEHDWQPVRYLYRSYSQEDLVEFYRAARVGLVTPLRDGMNLVAKEYVASQDPGNPGVLVLSSFAGAAEELSEAVIVNPYLPEETAQGIAEALAMPLEERRRRHQALREVIVRQNVHKWVDDFLSDLRNFQ
jgi:alpha,alpha-trehalose-phosphate synthase [UDP-forming]/trehalose-phosphatase